MNILASWFDFALATAPGAAVLAFVFMFTVGVICSLWVWRERSSRGPRWPLWFFGPILGVVSGVQIGYGVALFGWPALWLVEWIFGPSPRLEAWVVCFSRST